MSAQIAQDSEARLTAIFEWCHTTALDAGIPDANALPEGFTGTLGYFPVYFPDEIALRGGAVAGDLIA